MEKHMKLSEAIREGSKTTRPLRGSMYASCPRSEADIDRYPDGGLLATHACALGAATHHARRLGVLIDASTLKTFPIIDAQVSYPCACATVSSWTALGPLIVHLNDTHTWPREAIAEWVETIEKLEEQRQVTIAKPEPVSASAEPVATH